MHFITNKQGDGLGRLWNKGYVSIDMNVLDDEDAQTNVAALFDRFNRVPPAEFASLAVRYSGEQVNADTTLERYGLYLVEIRPEMMTDALILNGDVKSLAYDFTHGAPEKPRLIAFDIGIPDKTLTTLVALGRSRTNPRLTGNCPEAPPLRRLRGDDVLRVWIGNQTQHSPQFRADLEFLEDQGGTVVRENTPT